MKSITRRTPFRAQQIKENLLDSLAFNLHCKAQKWNNASRYIKIRAVVVHLQVHRFGSCLAHTFLSPKITSKKTGVADRMKTKRVVKVGLAFLMWLMISVATGSAQG